MVVVLLSGRVQADRSSAVLNHYPRHVGDFIRDTVGLSLSERGAYTALLDQYYASERPIAHAERYRITGAVSKADRAAVDYVMGRYFVEQADGWHQKRADKEIQAYRERSASAAASANARWDKRNANAMRTHSEGNANHKPVTNNQEEAKAKPPARKRAVFVPPDFSVSERVKTWAATKGYGRLAEHCEAFIRKALAKGYTYTDWDAALMNAIAEDWAGLRKQPPPGRQSVHDKRAETAAEIWKGVDGGSSNERVIDGEAERVA